MTVEYLHPWGADPRIINGGLAERTFNKAAESYLRQGGSTRYLDPVVAYFDGRDVQTIAPADVKQMALDLYPNHMSSTRNRQGITPARAVMFHAHEMGWCHHISVRSFKTSRSTKHSPASGAWFSAFINQCDSDQLFHLSALAVFMNQTAARVSEAINVFGEHVDFKARKVLLVKTKTDVMQTAYLTDELMYRLHNLGVGEGQRVFRYKCRWAVNERIKAVCGRAGIPYKSSHSVGRYSFATNAMNLGIGVKTAMDAGRWKSSKIFLETYVHTENAGRMVADRFNSQRYASL